MKGDTSINPVIIIGITIMLSAVILTVMSNGIQQSLLNALQEALKVK